MSVPDDLEALRAAVRQAAKGMSPRELAKASGVSHGTVYAFIAEGSTLEPQRATVERLRRFVAGGRPSVEGLTPASAFALGVAYQQAASARRLLAIIRDSAESALGDLDGLLGSGVLGEPEGTPSTTPIHQTHSRRVPAEDLAKDAPRGARRRPA